MCVWTRKKRKRRGAPLLLLPNQQTTHKEQTDAYSGVVASILALVSDMWQSRDVLIASQYGQAST